MSKERGPPQGGGRVPTTQAEGPPTEAEEVSASPSPPVANNFKPPKSRRRGGPVRQRPTPGSEGAAGPVSTARMACSPARSPQTPATRSLGGAGWDPELVRGGLPGQPCIPQGFLDIHVIAVKVHQDDVEVGVLRRPVQAGHVRDELLHPAGLVLHCQTQPQTSLRLTTGVPGAPPSPTKPTPLPTRGENLGTS